MTEDIAKYKEMLDQIWREFKPDVRYGIHDRIVRGELMFVGINPSEVNGNHQAEDANGNVVYAKGFSDEYPYFAKMKKISEDVGLEWAYVDYCFVIESNQSELLKKHFTKKMNAADEDGEKRYVHKPKDFIQKQYEVAKIIIKDASPKLIVVCNAKASELIKKDYKLSKKDFDNKIGTYRLNDLNGTPIIFSSMLSGQRALDNHSFERLEWQIKMILGKLK